MNVHVSTEASGPPTRAEAERAAALLRRYLEAAPAERETLMPAERLSHDYPAGFAADAAYRTTLPDLQNDGDVAGAPRTITHVGVAGFRVPVRHAVRGGDPITLAAHVTGTVALGPEAKGINMSRILRGFAARAEGMIDAAAMAGLLAGQLADLDSGAGRLMVRLSYPMRQRALRSGLQGWQYYDLAYEAVARGGGTETAMHLDYVYSSTCPCSMELAEHARATRAQMATPHAQRSLARLSVLAAGADLPAPEDLVAHARDAVPTETQVMVKREDEQAFAELNAANPVFVEDAVRRFAAALETDARIGDFRVAASHRESLHNHDAVAVLTRGAAFDAGGRLDPHLFDSLAR